MSTDESAEIVIVGGGPAGMMAGLLFARAGLETVVLEKHGDFFRDFRGDTVHPSTMEILYELGMLERFLERPHDRLTRAVVRVAGREHVVAELGRLRTPAPFIAMMPQWDFLDFLRKEASRFATFRLRMESEAVRLEKAGDRIGAVTLADGRQVEARKLVLAADGRSSLVRRTGLLKVEDLGAPMDVFWFRLAKRENAGDAVRASIATGRMAVLIDRGDYWQSALILPKGSAEAVRARGVDWVRRQVTEAFPDIDFPPDGGLQHPDDLKLLVVELDRLRHWHRPGLLAIGDAAHAMSPIGGVGINLAIQDAVAAANILAAPLREGAADHLLGEVQARREGPTRIIQSAQRGFQNRLIDRVLSGEPIERAPLPIRLFDRYPFLRRLPGRAIGLGFRREHVRSPQA